MNEIHTPANRRGRTRTQLALVSAPPRAKRWDFEEAYDGAPARREFRSPEQALAAAAIESAISDYIGVASVRRGLRASYPGGLNVGHDCPHLSAKADAAYESARRFLFVGGTALDFELCCAALRLCPQAVRFSVRLAEQRLGTPQEQRVGSRMRRVAKIVGVGAHHAGGL